MGKFLLPAPSRDRRRICKLLLEIIIKNLICEYEDPDNPLISIVGRLVPRWPELE